MSELETAIRAGERAARRLAARTTLDPTERRQLRRAIRVADFARNQLLEHQLVRISRELTELLSATPHDAPAITGDTRGGIAPDEIVSECLVILATAAQRWTPGRGRSLEELTRASLHKAIATRSGLAERRRLPTTSADALGIEELDRMCVEAVARPSSSRPDIDIVVATQMLEVLGSRAADVIDQRYGLGDGRPRTYAAIARELGVSRQGARSIERSALRRLRRRAEAGIFGADIAAALRNASSVTTSRRAAPTTNPSS